MKTESWEIDNSEMVKIDSLNLPDYQRPEHHTAIEKGKPLARYKKMAKEWIDLESKVIYVSRRRGGSLFVIDGWTRTMAAKLAGLTHMRALVYCGLTIGEEARLYDSQRKSKGIPKINSFECALLWGDPVATHLKEIIEEEYGLRIDGFSGTKTFAAIGTARVIYERWGGPDMLRRVLNLARNTWGFEEPYVKSATFMKAGVAVINAIDRSSAYIRDFESKMSSVPIAKIKRDAAGIAIETGFAKSKAVAMALVNAFNKGRRTTKLTLREVKTTPRNL
jgi:hypothetical protein